MNDVLSAADHEALLAAMELLQRNHAQRGEAEAVLADLAREGDALHRIFLHLSDAVRLQYQLRAEDTLNMQTGRITRALSGAAAG